MKGTIRFCSKHGKHVAIETQDGDYTVARVDSSGLRTDDTVLGDFVNPGKALLHRPSKPGLPMYVEGCRMREEAARQWIEAVDRVC